MTEIEIGSVEPTFDNGQRVAQMRYDAYLRGGMTKRSLKAHTYNYKIGTATPEEQTANRLPGANYFAHLEAIKLGNPHRRPVGAYVEGELVGISQSAPLTIDDQVLFETRRERKDASHIMGEVLQLRALMTLQNEQLDENEIAHALLMDAMEYAEGREVRTSQFITPENPITTLLVVHGFERTGRIATPVGNAKQELLIHPSSADVLADFAENN